MIPEIKITNHAYKRARERLRWSKDTLDRMVVIVYREGIIIENTVGTLRGYLNTLEEEGDIRIHGENLFVFSDRVLLTVYPLPSKYRKLMRTHIRAYLLETEEVVDDSDIINNVAHYTGQDLLLTRRALMILLFNEWGKSKKYNVHKSLLDNNGQQLPNGKFFVAAATPVGIVVLSFPENLWDRFKIPEKEKLQYRRDSISKDMYKKLEKLAMN